MQLAPGGDGRERPPVIRAEDGQQADGLRPRGIVERPVLERVEHLAMELPPVLETLMRDRANKRRVRDFSRRPGVGLEPGIGWCGSGLPTGCGERQERDEQGQRDEVAHRHPILPGI